MLKKTFRLSSRKDIQTTFLRGRSFFSPHFVVKFSPSANKRFTIIASMKVYRLAVERNRLKRILRETIRAGLRNFKNGDYIVVTKARAATLSAAEIRQSFNNFMEKIKLKQ